MTPSAIKEHATGDRSSKNGTLPPIFLAILPFFEKNVFRG